MDLHIKDVLKKFIKDQDVVGDQYYAQKVRNFWKERFAESINTRIRDISLYRGKLTVSVDSAPLRHELFMNRDKIKSEINEHLGENIVRYLELK